MQVDFLKNADTEISLNSDLFEKRTVLELTDDEMLEIEGGTTPVCAAVVASSGWCIAGSFALTVAIGLW